MIKLKNSIFNEDCLEGMRKLDDESIDTIVTSPPYLNAREYSQWESLEDYMEDMKSVFTESFRILKNNHNMVVNVSDIIGKTGKTMSTNRKIPLGAYFVVMLEEIGFRYVDDVIWDKGEVQSKRNFVGDGYPYQKYPINCYEHIIIVKKNEYPKQVPKCPVCHENNAYINGKTNGIITYECKNEKCTHKSPSGRGKRYSEMSNLTKHYSENDNNLIDEDTLKFWRRDLVKLNPVIKINSKGENKANHTAPFPIEIPEMAIKYFSGENDLVMDMFMGSGTTAKACLKNNRYYIGYEINKDYYTETIKSIENYKKNL